MAEAVSRSPDSSADASPSLRAVFGNRPFLYLWLAQIFSQLAQQMINYALVVQVAELAGSSTATGGIILCFTLPAVLFSAIAGVFVDRQSKRRVLIVTNVARGLVVLLYVLTVVLPHLETGYGLIILYATTLVFSAVSQFFVPAEGAMIPLLVERDELISANSLFNLTFTASQLIGFAFLGPLFVELIGYKWLYVVLFGCYGLCALLTWRLPDREQGRLVAAGNEHADGTDTLRDKVRLAYAEFQEGWTFIRADAALMIAILYWSVAISVFMMIGTIGPKFLTDVLHVDPQHLYFIMVPGGIGLVSGVILVGRFATERNRPAMINYALLSAGIGLLLLALAHGTLTQGARLLHQPEPPIAWSQVAMGVLAFLLGVVNSFISVPAQTVLQERAPEHIRARIFSAFFTVSNAILIVPILFAGTMADVVGVVQTIVIIAVLVLIVAVLGLRYMRAHADLLAAPPAAEPQAGLTTPPAPPAAEPQAVLPGLTPPEASAGPAINGAPAPGEAPAAAGRAADRERPGR